MKRGLAILAAAVIFIAGGVAGGALTFAFAPREEPRRQALPGPLSAERHRDYIDRLVRDADLTPEQKEQAEEIFAASRARLEALWKPVAPEARAELKRVRKEIMGILTPEQQARLEEKRKSRHKQRGDWRAPDNDKPDRAHR